MVEDIFDVVRDDCIKNNLDYVYESRIIYLIGYYGLRLLKEHDCLWNERIYNGRRIYSLKERTR